MSRSPSDRRYYESTGREQSSDPIVALLYYLLAIWVPAGWLWQLVERARRRRHTFTDGHRARQAKDMAARLRRRES